MSLELGAERVGDARVNPSRSLIRQGVAAILAAMPSLILMLASFGDYLDSTLALHIVVQHLIFLVGGYLFANGLDIVILSASRSSTRVTRVYMQLLRANFLLNRRGLILVGGLVFTSSKLLTQRTRHFVVLLPEKAMGIFGAFLLFTSEHVYEVYQVVEQATIGLIMVVMMLVMDPTILPYWFYAYFGKKTS